MVDVVLVGKDWQSRALLRAQLIEEGIEVDAHQTTAELGSPPLHPHPKARLPRLVIADVSASDNPDEDLDRFIAPSADPIHGPSGQRLIQVFSTLTFMA